MTWTYPLEAAEFLPLANLRQLQNEMNRWFDTDVLAGQVSYPMVSVWYDAEKAIAAALLPGVDPAKVDVTVNGNLLTISGERKPGLQMQPPGHECDGEEKCLAGISRRRRAHAALQGLNYRP